MIGYDKKMNILRKDCVSSIQQPNFIDNLDPILARTAWSLTYNMVINFTEGLQKSVIPQWRCELISKEIMDISDDLSKLVDDVSLLMIWLFVGETIEDWIDMAISLDCFESAENLKRILASSVKD
jgi:hypothetical protein